MNFSRPLAVLFVFLSSISLGLLAAPVAAQDSASQEAGNPRPGIQRRFSAQRGRTFAGGTVTSVGVDQFAVRRPNGTSLTVLVDDQTRYEDQGKAIQLEDLKVGDYVMIRPPSAEGGEAKQTQADGTAAAPSPSSITAAVVRVVPPSAMTAFNGDRAFGTITAISGNQITLENPQGGTTTVVVRSDAVMRRDRKSATLQDFKVGDRVFVMGKESNGQFAASRLMGGQFGPPGGRPGETKPKP
jgi:Domain of unknown function (DUF5666)